ncbi:MAG: hypothetical protein QM731_25585 [Chitinophagaceae bacterium]
MTRLGIIGDFNATVYTHQKTNEAVEHAAKLFGRSFQYEWVPTEQIENTFATITSSFDGFIIAPGSPYKNMQGVLKMIEFARVNRFPVLGTCGGFQHMVIEFARNVLNIKDAAHAEDDPYASRLVINPLSCNLKGSPLEVTITTEQSIAYKVFGTGKITEQYYCNFGLNPAYQQQLHDAGFSITGSDLHKEARILELDNHPFFVATLFVPQDNSSFEKPHPLMSALLAAMEQRKSDGNVQVSDTTAVK